MLIPAKYLFVLTLLVCSGVAVAAAAQDEPPQESHYQIQSGDILDISVWQEPDMHREVVVDPDGAFSYPIAGNVITRGKSVEAVRRELTRKLAKDLPDASVTVAVKQLLGNKIYVIGKVNRPGEFQLNRYVDVMQALSMAGGGTPYADLGNIEILRRVGGKQISIPFDYGQVEHGRHLEQNQFLKSGDTIVVP